MATSLIPISSFQYEPLEKVNHNIRLLKILPIANEDLIECTLEQGTLDQPYTCLSYCWGADRDHQSILVNDQVFLVRPNLHAFLTLAKEYGFDQPIWIDAISINQADTEEKSKQVQMMGKIYSHAVRTVVWLGLSPADCGRISSMSHFNSSAAEGWELEAWHAAFGKQTGFSKASKEVMEDARDGFSSAREKLMLTALHDGSSANPIWGMSVQEQHNSWADLLNRWCDLVNANDFIYRLASSDYWRRTWIIQELMLSKNAVLFCGEDHATVNGILPLILNMVYTIRCRYEEQSVEWQRLHDLQMVIFSITREITGTSPVIATETHFALAMRLTAGRLCTDTRDRVFAIVSLVKNGDKFKIDYKQSLEELLVNVLRFHIANRGLDLTIKRVLPLLLENTANTLEIQPPDFKALPDMSSVLDSLGDFNSFKGRAFWVRPMTRVGPDFPSASDQNCSLCLGIEICGLEGILEFWCPSIWLKCHINNFWWRRMNDGRWRCDVAGEVADDLLELE